MLLPILLRFLRTKNNAVVHVGKEREQTTADIVATYRSPYCPSFFYTSWNKKVDVQEIVWFQVSRSERQSLVVVHRQTHTLHIIERREKYHWSWKNRDCPPVHALEMVNRVVVHNCILFLCSLEVGNMINMMINAEVPVQRRILLGIQLIV